MNSERKQTSRREFIRTTSITALGSFCLLALDSSSLYAFTTGIQEGGFTLPALQYGYDALEPHIDARTMEIHHTKHHQAYINNLNKAISENPKLKDKSLQQLFDMLPKMDKKVQATVRNNAGGHWNHTFFWSILKPKPGKISDNLKQLIESHYKSMQNFQAEFEKAAMGVFGSGWAWLTISKKGEPKIIATPNQDNPLMTDKHLKILMGVDVWEHAYYLKYQNKRADYLKAFWNVLDWEKVSEYHEGK